MRAAKKMSLVVAAITLSVITGRAARGAEEVVFSTPGFTMTLSGNTKASTTPFGFWIWCAAEAADGSKGGYQNANACQGSMYFYALDKHVTPIIGQVSETSDGIYQMSVVEGTFAQLLHNSLTPSYVCTLANVTPDPKGPGNAVDVACTFLDPSLGSGTGSAHVTNAVVNVTGG